MKTDSIVDNEIKYRQNASKHIDKLCELTEDYKIGINSSYSTMCQAIDILIAVFGHDYKLYSEIHNDYRKAFDMKFTE